MPCTPGRKIQHRLKGGKERYQKSGLLSPKLRRALEDAAHEAGVSESFILCVALADFLGIKGQEPYY